MRFELVDPPARRLALDHELIWPAVGLLGAGVALGIERLPTPLFGSLCAFHLLTGLPCPGCGGTRAVLALLRLDPAAALAFNPLVALLAITGLAFVPYALATLAFGTRRLRLAGLGAADRLLMVAAVLLNWVYLIADGR